MARVPSVLFLAVTVFWSSCSNLPNLSAGDKPKAQSSDSEAIVRNPGFAKGKTPSVVSDTPEYSIEVDEQESSKFVNLGLPKFCSVETNSYSFCVSCTPRQISNKKCGPLIVKTFDPNEYCGHNKEKIVCKQKHVDYFEFNFAKRSSLEQLYERLPILIMGAKMLLGVRLDAYPSSRDALFQAFDALIENRLALFTCGDISPAIEAFANAAKVFDADLSAEKISAFKENAILGASLYQTVCKAGVINDQVLIGMLGDLLAFLPGDLGKILSNFELAGIISALQNGQGFDEVLQGVDLEALIAEIVDMSAPKMPISTSTATATSTAIATNTETGIMTSTATSTAIETGTATATQTAP